MNKEHYTEVKHHYIYIIYHEIDHATFIGKTYSSDPYTVLGAHLRGERASTREDFGSDPDWNDLVNFHILESLECTGAEAYRHVIAWCRFFEDANFLLIVPYGTARYSEYFQPETQAIYDTVCAPFTVEEVLNREISLWEGKPCSTSPTPLSNDEGGDCNAALFQLNVRVTYDVSEGFKRFCKRMGVTQSNGLRLLLLSQQEKCPRIVAHSYQEDMLAKADTIAKLKEELRKAKEKLVALPKPKNEEKARSTVIRRAVKQALRQQKPASYLTPLLPISFYKAKGVVDFSSYSYPSEEGVCFLALDALVYGRSHLKQFSPLFVLGRTADGSRLKLRWYPKKEFVGISPTSRSPFYHKGSFWSVGYALANDGAYDLYAAIPAESLEPAPMFEDSLPAPSTRSLDSIIASAEVSK